MRTGWFKVHRQVFDNPICTKDAEYFFVWCYLLSEARYEEERVIFGKEEILLEKGQLITTTKEIASKLNISESKVVRILKRFEIEKQIEKRTSTKNTVISILSWDLYQESEEQNDKRVKNERKTNEKPVTNERKTNGKPSYYIKEDKKEINEEIKNERKEEYIDGESDEDFFERIWKLYPRKEGKGSVSKIQKKKLHKIGYEQLERCIHRYLDYFNKTYNDEKFLKHGSTFFNSGYVDYLDENYKANDDLKETTYIDYQMQKLKEKSKNTNKIDWNNV